MLVTFMQSSCFYSLYLTLLFPTGTPENRPRCLSCEKTCEEDANDHVKACSSLRMLSKFLHLIQEINVVSIKKTEKRTGQHADHFNK